ncbi:MAG: hypothetical protein VYE68_03990 [Acidobacteriota bacterium]|nr:hypothetical protein [Acidobacteriota bacterium]
MARSPLAFEHTTVITAAPDSVLAAFFDPIALSNWWDTVRSVTTPRPLGIYAIEWRVTPFSDQLLGTLGGVFYGTVMEFHPGREFFLADAYWLPPQSNPFGPMALEVSCRVSGPATHLRVRQSGSDEGARWERYYDVISAGWKASLSDLKGYLERERSDDLDSRASRPRAVSVQTPAVSPSRPFSDKPEVLPRTQVSEPIPAPVIRPSTSLPQPTPPVIQEHTSPTSTPTAGSTGSPGGQTPVKPKPTSQTSISSAKHLARRRRRRKGRS